MIMSLDSTLFPFRAVKATAIPSIRIMEEIKLLCICGDYVYANRLWGMSRFELTGYDIKSISGKS